MNANTTATCNFANIRTSGPSSIFYPKYTSELVRNTSEHVSSWKQCGFLQSSGSRGIFGRPSGISKIQAQWHVKTNVADTEPTRQNKRNCQSPRLKIFFSLIIARDLQGDVIPSIYFITSFPQNILNFDNENFVLNIDVINFRSPGMHALFIALIDFYHISNSSGLFTI